MHEMLVNDDANHYSPEARQCSLLGSGCDMEHYVDV